MIEHRTSLPLKVNFNGWDQLVYYGYELYKCQLLRHYYQCISFQKWTVASPLMQGVEYISARIYAGKLCLVQFTRSRTSQFHQTFGPNQKARRWYRETVWNWRMTWCDLSRGTIRIHWIWSFIYQGFWISRSWFDLSRKGLDHRFNLIIFHELKAFLLF